MELLETRESVRYIRSTLKELPDLAKIKQVIVIMHTMEMDAITIYDRLVDKISHEELNDQGIYRPDDNGKPQYFDSEGELQRDWIPELQIPRHEIWSARDHIIRIATEMNAANEKIEAVKKLQ